MWTSEAWTNTEPGRQYHHTGRTLHGPAVPQREPSMTCSVVQEHMTGKHVTEEELQLHDNVYIITREAEGSWF